MAKQKLSPTYTLRKQLQKIQLALKNNLKAAEQTI